MQFTISKQNKYLYEVKDSQLFNFKKKYYCPYNN